MIIDLGLAENGKSCQHCVNKSGGDRWREFALLSPNSERDVLDCSDGREMRSRTRLPHNLNLLFNAKRRASFITALRERDSVSKAPL